MLSSKQAMSPECRPTVVLLHSSAGSARQWKGLIEVLRPRFQVHAVEFHGHGERPGWRGDSPLTLGDEAALVEPLLAQSGGAHIVAHSYGAAVAVKLATMHPQWVRSLVAYEPVLFRLLIDDKASAAQARDIVAMAASIRALLAHGKPHLAAQRFIDFWSGAGAWTSLPHDKQNDIATRMPTVHQHFGALLHGWPTRAQLARLNMPMLFMTGTGTVAAMRRLAQLLRLSLPYARHELLPAMGHMGPITHAAEVNPRIVEFLHAHADTTSTVELSSELG
jgi:pimeloyl-ACP methyl ester carboxylesterase